MRRLRLAAVLRLIYRLRRIVPTFRTVGAEQRSNTAAAKYALNDVRSTTCGCLRALLFNTVLAARPAAFHIEKEPKRNALPRRRRRKGLQPPLTSARIMTAGLEVVDPTGTQHLHKRWVRLLQETRQAGLARELNDNSECWMDDHEVEDDHEAMREVC